VATRDILFFKKLSADRSSTPNHRLQGFPPAPPGGARTFATSTDTESADDTLHITEGRIENVQVVPKRK